MSNVTYVGLDVHQETIQVAVLRAGRKKPEEWIQPNGPNAASALAKRLRGFGTVMACYEAGPTGYGLKRALDAREVPCIVVAPSLIPRRAGERIKTDRKDARKLAEYLRAELLTEVRPPTVEEEGVRDLVRLRESAGEDVRRTKQRLGKMLLRYGLVFRQGTNWTAKHLNWIKSQRLSSVAQEVLEAHLAELDRLVERERTLRRRIEEIAATEKYAARVGVLRCFRGIDMTTAMMLLAELHGFERFQDPRQLMAFVGLVPSEHSSGGSTRRGAITKTGNGHVRRVLVESAQHAPKRPRESRKLAMRRRGQPDWAIALADKAMHRLYRRYWRLDGRGKPRNKAIVAVARELLGFVWAALTELELREREVAAA